MPLHFGRPARNPRRHRRFPGHFIGTVLIEALEPRRLLDGIALDPTFGQGGLVTTDVPGQSSDSAAGIAITQPDGKILVAGNAYQPYPGDHFLLARYDADGALDTSFGTGGYVKDGYNTATEGFNWQVYAMAIDPTSGDIVVAGRGRDVTYGPSGTYDVALARFTPDGILDTSFGDSATGIVTTAVGNSTENGEAHALAIDASGNIYIAGQVDSSYSQNVSELLLARYNNDGTLDTTFGGQHGVITNLGGSTTTANALTIDGGDLVVAGNFQPAGASGSQTLVAKFHSDNGALDTSFNGTGFATATFDDNGLAYATTVTTDSNHDVLVAGWAWASGNDGSQELIMARYTSTGALDTSFGTSGQVAAIHAGDFRDAANAVAIDSSGNIVVAGRSDPLSNPYYQSNFAAFRFTPSGAFDPNFGAGGETAVNLGSSFTENQASALALTSAGQIVLAGDADHPVSQYAFPSNLNDFALARLSETGTLDTSFGVKGTVLSNFQVATSNGARAMAIQSDGKIVVAGDAWAADARGFVVARYNANGSLDKTFGVNGVAFTNVNGATYPKQDNIAYAVAIDSQGRIVVVGTSDPNYYRTEVAVVRYTPKGQLDSTFGDNGIALTPLGSINNSDATGSAVAIDGNDNILVGGSVQTFQSNANQGWNFFLERLTAATGALDPKFGGGTGQVQTDFGGIYDYAHAIVLQPDGKIVLAGSSHQNTTGDDFALARYNVDGSLDTSFGDLTAAGERTGMVTTNFASANTPDGTDDAYGLAIDSQGRLIAAGASNAANYNGYARYGFALARYTSDGTLDNTFGGGTGQVLTAASPYFDTYGGPVVVTPTGKILVGGVGPTVYYNNRDFLIAQYNDNGSLDTTFTAGDQHTPSGVERTDFSTPSGGYHFSDDQIYGMALDQQGRLVAAGGSYQPQTNYDIGLARYVLALTANPGGPYTIAEGDSLTLAATASGGDGGPYTYSWDVNGDEMLVDATGSSPTLTWAQLESLSPPVDDGPATFQVRVQVSDAHGDVVVSDATTLTVNNTPPTVSVSGPAVEVRGQPQTFTFTGSDPSKADTGAGFSFLVDWGDGSAPQPIGAASGVTTVEATHVYTGSGTYTAQAMATDKDGGQSPPGTVTAVVQAAAMEGGTLVVGGTTGDDTIVLAPDDRVGDVSVTINGASAGVFHPIQEIVVYAQAGNDRVSFQGLQGHGPRAYVAVRTAIFGGDGNDTLDARGADASTILVGGAGNDVLYGGPRRNVLIGGLGSDSLVAGNAGDILIDGTTDFDDNLAALNAIMDEWGRTDLDYQARVDQLDGTTPGGLNAPYVLNSSTVQDDASVDTLRGGRGQDWLFYQSAGPDADDVTDRHHGHG